MLPELPQVKARRLRLAINQSEFAKESGVSQSFIAKLESGRIEPSYVLAKQVFATLDRLESTSGGRARDIMTKRIISVAENDTLSKASKLMRANVVSQLPVMHGDLPIGCICEKCILDQINSGTSMAAITKMRVKDVMDEPFPIVKDDAPLKAVYSLLEFSPAILVKSGNKLGGIISRSDLLKLH